jgi:hypothetical protein
MTLQTYEVTLETLTGDKRVVTVPSPSGVQAGDAARPLMQDGEAILEIVERRDDEQRHFDAAPPKTQAEELAPVTEGAAAVSNSTGGLNHG